MAYLCPGTVLNVCGTTTWLLFLSLDGNADLVTLDGGDIYQAGKKYGLVPVMGEDYGTGDASYWAVAVVKSDTSFTINDLKVIL